MKVAIVGSRGFPSESQVMSRLVTLVRFYGNVTLISGGASGVDTWARQFAANSGLRFEEYRANWEAFGKKAGPLRNLEIVEAADMAIAFWDGESRGTKSSIDLALKLRKHLEVIFPEAAQAAPTGEEGGEG